MSDSLSRSAWPMTGDGTSMAARASMPSYEPKGSSVANIAWSASCDKQAYALGSQRHRICTTDSYHSDPVAPNLLQRDFTAPAPNCKWLTDITAIGTAEGWLYLAVVLDVYSRLVVGWAMASHRQESLVEEALLMALGWRNPIEELMHHSDRGSQYTSLGDLALLAQFHLQVSMSGKGDCYDNAMMESFTSIAQNRVCESARLSEPCRGQTIHL